MAKCNYSSLVGGECGASSENPTNAECVVIGQCTKDVHGQLSLYKVSEDAGVDSESKLLLARAGIFEVQEPHLTMSVCPRHRSLFGTRWRCNRTQCAIPSAIAAHGSTGSKGQCGLKSAQSAYVLRTTNILVPVGSPTCKRCREHLTALVAQPVILQPSQLQQATSREESDLRPSTIDPSVEEQEEEGSATSEEMAVSFGRLKVTDDSYLLSPETGSTVSSSGDGNGSATSCSGPRETFNVFLNQCHIEPLGRPWLLWDEVTERTRRRYVQRSSEIVSTVLKVISPPNAPHLWEALQSSSTVNQQMGARQAHLPAEKAYLEALAEAYNNATSWDTRRQVLSVMAGVTSFSAISEYIPGLTQYRYTMANLHRVQFGRSAPVPSQRAPRIRIDLQQLDHFLSYITSPHLVQDLPFGEKHLKLSSGKIITVPNVIRTMIPERIVTQYTQYCAESNFEPPSRRTMLRILTECSASVRKSLQGLDYFAAQGARGFDDLSSIVQEITLLRADTADWATTIQDSLKAGKLYLKGDCKVHTYCQSTVADHCSVFALSDPNDIEFRQRCDHQHDDHCDQCQALDVVLEEIGKAIQDAIFRSEEERDETLYIFDSAKLAIQAWKGHQLRSVRQDQSRLDVLDLLSPETVLIVNDWAMKFLPQLYRESQQDWFGKRGISWHISVVFRRLNGEMQSQAFVHAIQSCSQDSNAVVLMMQHVLKTLKSEHPDITRAFFRQDNAGCYKCANTVLACPIIERSTGIKVARLDFSDPQDGKGPADRMAATCKSHIRIYINEGHDVTTAEGMKEALLSHGGVSGVRVTVLPAMHETAQQKKISGISKLNNFEFSDKKLLAWRAYNIGPGKLIDVGSVTDVDYGWLSTTFSDGDFKSVSARVSRQPAVGSTADVQHDVPETPVSSTSMYSCPKEGCVRVFQRLSALERHLSLEACELSPERFSILDLAKQKYASRLQEGVGLIPSLQVPVSDSPSSYQQTSREGWALKETKKAYRFNEKQKSYLEAKFNIGQATGRKLDPDVVAKEMRRARGADGERLFAVAEFLSPQQVSSFFSRLAAKVRQQQVEVTDQDVLAAEEQENFCTARESVLSSLQINHPVLVDQYDLCALVKSDKVKKLKLGLLRVLCERLELQVPTPAVRVKAPYIALLQELVKCCPCFAE